MSMKTDVSECWLKVFLHILADVLWLHTCGSIYSTVVAVMCSSAALSTQVRADLSVEADTLGEGWCSDADDAQRSSSSQLNVRLQWANYWAYQHSVAFSDKNYLLIM